MKKLLLLLFPILLFSCTAEEVGSSGPIVGTWKYVRLLEHPENGDEVLIREASECELLKRLTFNNNNNLTTVYYKIIPVEGECEINTAAAEGEITIEKSEEVYIQT